MLYEIHGDSSRNLIGNLWFFLFTLLTDSQFNRKTEPRIDINIRTKNVCVLILVTQQDFLGIFHLYDHFQVTFNLISARFRFQLNQFSNFIERDSRTSYCSLQNLITHYYCIILKLFLNLIRVKSQ